MSSTSLPKVSSSESQITKISISQYLRSLPASSQPTTFSPKTSSKRNTSNSMLEYYLAESPKDGANMYCRCHSGDHPSLLSSSQSLSSAIASRKQESTTHASQTVNAFDSAFSENRQR